MKVAKKEITIIETQIELSRAEIKFLSEVLGYGIDPGNLGHSLTKRFYDCIYFLEKYNYSCIDELQILLDDFVHKLDCIHNEYEEYGIDNLKNSYSNISIKGISKNMKMMKRFYDLYTKNTVLVLKE